MANKTNRVLVLGSLLAPILMVIFGACNKESKIKTFINLELVREIDLAVKEPSGLCYSADHNAFYTVSDNSAGVYKLSSSGALIKQLKYKGQDLEGVTVNPNNGNIYVVEERKRELVQLDSEGNEINSRHLDIEQNDTNKGLEGVAFNPKNNHIYLLNEKNPGLLIELDESGKIIKQTDLDFAIDYSGIFYEQTEDVLWIVSDKSKSISKCDLNGKKLNSYKIKESKAEGIVVDPDLKMIYVVLDGLDKLQVYKY